MTAPTTAEVGHGNKQEQIMSWTGSPRRAAFMRFKQLAIVTLFVVGAAMGYGGEYDAATAVQALSPDLHDLRRAFDTRRRSTMMPTVWSGTDGSRSKGRVLKKMQERPSWESCS